MATAQQTVGKQGTSWYAPLTHNVLTNPSSVPTAIMNDMTKPFTNQLASSLKTAGLWLLAIALVIVGFVILFRDSSLPTPPTPNIASSPSSDGGEAEVAEAAEVA